jgi:hypothetical protein
MSSQRKILAAVAVVVIIVAIAAVVAWHKSNKLTLDPTADTVSPTGIISASTPPAEVVSNTTFDIISPTSQPTNLIKAEKMPGSSGY